MRSPVLSAAIAYARRGWSVFPLQGKRPLPGTAGHRDATTDLKVIKSWWREYPDANVGIRCDSASGPVIIDQDGPEGIPSIKSLGLPPTLKASSGRKHRRHYYFDGAVEEVRRAIKVLPGVDLLGDGGYVVAPPSIHPETGRPYRWVNERDPVVLDESLLKTIHEIGANGKKRQAPPMPEIIYEGERDQILTSLAGSMRRRGASEEAILAALLEENELRVKPPMSLGQLKKIARSIAKKDPAAIVEDLTDMGNARRFARKYGRDVRHVSRWKNPWVLWDGTRWTPDETNEVARYARATIREMYGEAEAVGDDQVKEQVLKHALRSQASSRVKAIVDLAGSEPEIASVADAFDADPWLFNVENGTINLATGELQKHQRSDLITNMAPVVFDPRAKAPTWEGFLHDVTDGNKDLEKFLQRAIGYSISGDVREQCLFFCFGSGQNGKSTFLEIIREMVGDYSQQAEFSTFLEKKGEGPRNDLARMRGKRFVTAVEAAANRSFDEAVIKQLTGGDTVTARKLYEEHFEFHPTHKIFLAANHKPRLNDQTESMWRRIRMIPFTVYIPPEKRDSLLKDKLRREMSGILNWAIAGCLDWLENGLGVPEVVEDATESYREEEDLVGEFIESSCRLNEKKWTSTSDLYQGFTVWWMESRGTHNRPPSLSWFGRALSERPDLRPGKRKGRRGWRGITLRF